MGAEEGAEDAEMAEEAVEATEEATEEAAEEATEEATEEAMETEETVEEPAKFVVTGPPSGPKAEIAIITKLQNKSEEDLTSVERDILAAHARQDKFSTGEDTNFKISDELKRKLRAQRFGPVVLDNPRRKKARMSDAVDDEERRKREARAARFSFTGQPDEKPTEAEAEAEAEVEAEAEAAAEEAVEEAEEAVEEVAEEETVEEAAVAAAQ